MSKRQQEQRTTISAIIKEIIRESGTSQAKVADALGYTTQSGVSERLRGDMRIWGAMKILDYLGYDIVIRDRKGKDRDRIVKSMDEYDELEGLADLEDIDDLDEIG